MSLALAATSAQVLAERDQGSLIRRIRWTQPQLDFLRMVSTLPVLLRSGNQWLGKTTVGAADLLLRLAGAHPYDPRGRVLPCLAVAVSPTDTHSIGLQKKVWDLADKSLLAPGQEYAVGSGMRGRHPHLRFRNGSVLHYRTDRQGAMTLSGITADHVLVDELCSRRVFDELKNRLTRRGGTMRLALTPINAPAEWLRDEAAAGRVVDLHYRAEARWCVPVGATEPLRDPTGTPMDQAWIDRLIASTDPSEVDVTVHGGWQVAHVDRSFAAWSESLVLSATIPEIIDAGIGIDYGEDPGRWVVVLVARARGGDVLVLGEWTATGRESAADAARGIVEMLAGWGSTPAAIRRWVGDVNSAGPLSGGRSMNEIMADALRVYDPTLEIGTAWKPRGSVDARFSVMNAAMAARKVWVHESCRRVLEAVRGHRRGQKRAGYLKDPIDAVWYVAQPWLEMIAPLPRAVRIGY